MTAEQDSNRNEFTRAVIRIYLTLPETPRRAGRIDWILANHLFDRKIGIGTIKNALTLASVRRLSRSPEMPILGPIRSLNYFVPIIEELIQQPLPEGYEEYLQRKLTMLSKNAKTAKTSSPALDHIPTIPRDR